MCSVAPLPPLLLIRLPRPPVMKSLPALLLLLAACHSPSPTFHPSPDPALATLPFSEAVTAHGFLFLSGQIAITPGTLDVVPGGIEAETNQVLDQIESILARHGCTLHDVVKATVFLADMSDWPKFNELYRQRFHHDFPARSALGAAALARGARVELEVIAALPTAR